MVKSKAKKAEVREPEPSVEPESVTVVTPVLPEETASGLSKGSPEAVEEWFKKQPKDEELANNVDKIIESNSKPEPKPDDILKVQAVWQLGYDDHKYEKGDIFEDTRERLSRLSQKHLKYL
jgi:hypothetical protein